MVPLQLEYLFALDLKGAFVLFDPVPIEHPDFDNGAVVAGRETERSVPNIGSLLAEDRSKQLFFRRHRRFALRSYLSNQNVARPDLGADVNDASLVQVPQRFLADVGDVASDLFRSQLRVARGNLELFNVDGCEDIVPRDALGYQNRIFEVVAVPRHERDEHIAAERKLAQVRRRSVRDHLAPFDPVADIDQRTLVDAGVLVRPLEFPKPVDVDSRIAQIQLFRDPDNDSGRVHLVDDAASRGRDCRA